MFDTMIKAVVGDLGDKRAYREMMKRANALPKEYRYAFRKMRDYIFTVGVPGGDVSGCVDLALFHGLIDLLEAGAAEHKTVPELTGADVAAFCDELLRAHAVDEATWRKNQNQTILDSISKENEPC